jgi:virulence-associated protein VagC
MKTAEVIETDGVQAIQLPEEFHLPGKWVQVRRQGEAIMLLPVVPSAWPADFLETLWNSDEADASQELQPSPRMPLD